VHTVIVSTDHDASTAGWQLDQQQVLVVGIINPVQIVLEKPKVP
jgi:hypothetical protein